MQNVKLVTKSSASKGFTLIELMIVVAIVGILASIALPAFTTYIKRSKTSEATTNLAAMFTGVATYYTVERNDPATAGQSIAYCRVADAASATVEPAGIKVAGDFATSGSWSAIGFQPGDPLYYRYQTIRSSSVATNCGLAVGVGAYTLRATGDLDGDAAPSQFDLTVTSDANNSLSRSPTVTITNELE